MKFVFILILSAAYFEVGFAAERTVLIETFTNYTSPPDWAANPAHDSAINAMSRDTVIQIKYHTWWPSTAEEFFLWNSSEVVQRVNFYGVIGVPHHKIDGIINMTPSSGNAGTMRNSVRQRKAIAAPCSLLVSAYRANDSTITFAVNVFAEVDMTDSTSRLFVTLATNMQIGATPPSGGETVFYNIFRDFDESAGTLFTVAQEERFVISGNLFCDPTWITNNLFTVAFVQHTINNEILQSGWSSVSINGIGITMPNGGESWPVLSNQQVLWHAELFVSPVSISLNRHYPSGPWETITDSTENDGQYEWFVTDPLSDSCRIRICAVQDTFCDISDGNFSITSSQGYLALARPSAPNSPVLAWDAGTAECPNIIQETFRLKNFGSEAIVVFQPLEPNSAEFSRTTSCGTFFALAPGQMSACSLSISYAPFAEGATFDTLRVQTDAINGTGGYVKIPLHGEQLRTPETPQIVIQPQGISARLSWNPVTESIGGCPINVTAYLVFYSQNSGGPYFFHGFTTDTTYIHSGVLHFAPAMFYQVIATTEILPNLVRIPPGTEMSAILR